MNSALNQRGMTIIEMMMVVSLLAILGAMVIASVSEDDRAPAEAAARILSSDLEYAQTLAVARPQQRVAVAIDADGAGWRIIDADMPGQPLQDALDGTATPRTLAVRSGEGRLSMAPTARFAPAGTQIIFDALGGLEIPTQPDASLTITTDQHSRTLHVQADTGFVTLDP